MLKRNALWLALAAAGLLTGEGYPAAGAGEAGAEEAFIPELTLLDGTVCGGAASAFGNGFMLLAQAGKTEVGTAVELQDKLLYTEREARAVERHLARPWFGERERLDLARL